jgi:hypothetical protein
MAWFAFGFASGFVSVGARLGKFVERIAVELEIDRGEEAFELIRRGCAGDGSGDRGLR